MAEDVAIAGGEPARNEIGAVEVTVDRKSVRRTWTALVGAVALLATLVPVASAAPAAPAIRTGAVIQAGAHCTKPDYPSASRRMEEEGTVTLKFLIGVDGKVIQADIEKTSGFTRLDEAARNALSKCQFRPGTVDGKPEQSWASIKYTWRLE